MFLDRDGVINRGLVKDGKPFAPFTLQEFDILPGVSEALASLHAAGYLLILTTNQPDVARGHATRAQAEAIIAHMRRQLPLDDVLVCYHDDIDGCVCRKPKPGMIIAAAVAHDVQAREELHDWRPVAGHRIR